MLCRSRCLALLCPSLFGERAEDTHRDEVEEESLLVEGEGGANEAAGAADAERGAPEEPANMLTEEQIRDLVDSQVRLLRATAGLGGPRGALANRPPPPSPPPPPPAQGAGRPGRALGGGGRRGR